MYPSKFPNAMFSRAFSILKNNGNVFLNNCHKQEQNFKIDLVKNKTFL